MQLCLWGTETKEGLSDLALHMFIPIFQCSPSHFSYEVESRVFPNSDFGGSPSLENLSFDVVWWSSFPAPACPACPVSHAPFIIQILETVLTNVNPGWKFWEFHPQNWYIPLSAWGCEFFFIITWYQSRTHLRISLAESWSFSLSNATGWAGQLTEPVVGGSANQGAECWGVETNSFAVPLA